MKFQVVAAVLAAATMVSASMSSQSEQAYLAARSDELLEREFDDLDLYERSFEDEVFERDFDDLFDEVVARELVDLESREYKGKLYVNVKGTKNPPTIAKVEKYLRKYTEKLDMFPYCDVEFGDGGYCKYRCYSSAAKKIGQQGPAGAMSINK